MRLLATGQEWIAQRLVGVSGRVDGRIVDDRRVIDQRCGWVVRPRLVDLDRFTVERGISEECRGRTELRVRVATVKE